MGNDGGSIPTRRELVKEAAKARTATQIKEAQQESQEYAWNHDPLSRKPLAVPVVSDSAGVLYNKDSILEYLLAETKDAEQEKLIDGRIKGLKDVVEVKFEVDKDADNDSERRNGTGRRERWVCPVTRVEMGPGAKGVYLVPCGHAFAGSVVREVQDRTCAQCNEAYAENDVIPILPTAATDIARLTLRVKTLREKGLTHALKKAPGSKKRKKHANGEAAAETADTRPSSEEDKKKEKEKQVRAASNGIKNASTAFLTKKVLEEQEERNKRRKLEQNENVKSLFKKSENRVAAGNSADYMTRGFSIGKK